MEQSLVSIFTSSMGFDIEYRFIVAVCCSFVDKFLPASVIFNAEITTE